MVFALCVPCSTCLLGGSYIDAVYPRNEQNVFNYRFEEVDVLRNPKCNCDPAEGLDRDIVSTGQGDGS